MPHDGRRGVLFAAVAALVAAGCLGGPPPGTPVADAADASILAALDALLPNDHDHADPALHPGAGWRMHEIAVLPMPMEGVPPAPTSELSIVDGYAYVTSFNPSAGFTILDLADPAAPRQVGHHDAGTAFTNDVKVTPDGAWAFVATQPDALIYLVAEEDPGLLLREAAGGGTPLAGDHGVQIVDVRDKTAPRLAGVYASSDPAGYHRLDLIDIGGVLHVAGAAGVLGRVDVLRFEPAPIPHLVPVSTYGGPGPQDASDPTRGTVLSDSGVHDVWTTIDPLDGFPLLVVAHWAAGVHLVDLSDPAAPRALGVWDDFVGVPEGQGNVHVAQVTAIEGRRIVVAVPEMGMSERQGIVWIIDATVPSAMELIGTWELPGVHPFSETFVYDTNRVEIRDGYVYLTHFHAGAYVLDIGTIAKARAPELRGYVIPRGETPLPWLGIGSNPLIYDAVPHAGHLYASDLTGGLRVIRLDPEVAPPREA